MALFLLAGGDSLARYSYLEGSERLLIELLFTSKASRSIETTKPFYASLGEMPKQIDSKVKSRII